MPYEDEPLAEQVSRGMGRAGRSAVGHVRRADTFVLVVVLVVATIASTMAFGNSRWAQMTTTLLQAVTLLVAAMVARVRRRALRAIAVLSLVTAAGGVLAAAFADDVGRGSVVQGVLALTGPLIVWQGLKRETSVNREVVAGAVSIYLLLGLTFSFAYQTVQHLSGEPFFANGTVGEAADFVYFSFITMATVGYGDLTPAGNVGRSMAVMEALAGQLYLVTVVALVVANLGHALPRRRAREDDAPG